MTGHCGEGYCGILAGRDVCDCECMDCVLVKDAELGAAAVEYLKDNDDETRGT